MGTEDASAISVAALPGLATRGLGCMRGERLLFAGLDLALQRGEALQIQGPNGSGKTTLLRILCGLMLPTEGRVCWRGTDIGDDPGGYRSEVIYIGHANGIKLDLTPLENLRWARALGTCPTALAAEDILERVGLGAFVDTPTRALSAGQRRRIALARLLALEASLWILDEPFTALDREGMAAMQAMLRRHLEHGGLCAFSTHQAVPLDGCAVHGLDLAA